MRLRFAASFVALAGCGTLLGIDDFGPAGTDGSTSTRTISGLLTRDDGQLTFPVLANTQISLRDEAGNIAQSTVSDGGGRYSLIVPAGGAIGFVDVLAGGDVFAPRRYLDNSGSLLDGSFNLTAYATARLGQLATAASATQSFASGLIIITVEDATATPLAGAVVVTHGLGQPRYHSNTTNAPGPDGTSTDSSGEVWAFDVPPGPVTVSAVLGTRAADRTVLVAADTIVSIRLRLQ